MQIHKIGIINLMAILVIFSPLSVHKYMLLYILQQRKIQKNMNIIYKNINLNDHYTVPGLNEMVIGLRHKIGTQKIGKSSTIVE